MRRFFTVLGRIVLTLVAIVGLGIAFAAWQGRGLDESSKSYAEANLPPILSTWSLDEVLKRSTKGMYEQLKSDTQQTDKLFTHFAKLGSFKNLEKLTCNARVFLNPLHGYTTTAGCDATAHFEKGDGKLSVLLAMEDEQWRIHAFRLDSPALLD